MITILFYLLKVVLCSAVLYTYYWFVLRNKQFHQYNRFYLMGISVLSWIVPLITIQIVKEQDIASSKVLHIANFISENNSLLEQEIIENTANYTWDNLLIIIGIVISLFFIVRFVKSLWDIRKLIRLYPLKELKGINLVMTDVKGTPFSFFKYIFWNTAIDLSSDVGKKILAHEVVHIEEKHSVDKLLIELQLLMGWFNPIVWLIRNELYLIHEYIADQKSIENQDSGVLAKLLLASAYPKQQHLLTNTFFYSPIKRRLFMLNQNKKTKFSNLRRLFVLPIIICIVLSFSIKTIEVKASAITRENFEKSITKIQIKSDTLPKAKSSGLRGGQVRMTSKTSTDTIVYTPSSENNKVKFSNLTLTTKDKQKVLDALEKKANVVIEKKTENGSEKYIIVNNNPAIPSIKPAFYLDGVKITEKEMKAISPNDIESVNILKGENAIKKYPEDGKYGVMEIKLKLKNHN
jgi:beta-lactamase regulating signal transducer with metallopeptidase domain